MEFRKILNRTEIDSVRFGSVRFETEPIPSLILIMTVSDMRSLLSYMDTWQSLLELKEIDSMPYYFLSLWLLWNALDRSVFVWS